MLAVKQNKSLSNKVSPETFEEIIVWHAIRFTWVFYLLGAVYLVGPIVAWLLLTVLIYRFLMGAWYRLSPALWLWALGMLMMLFAIVVGHVNFDLSTASLIKSIIGWAKGWALIAIFPILALLRIRPELIVRACGHLCFQTLFIAPLLIIAPFIGLPGYLYTSPLKFLAAHSFFEIELYGINASNGLPRWRLFAPWGPALGLMGNLLFFLSFHEKNQQWRWIGIFASILMVILSQSRMGLLCLLIVPILAWGISNLRNPIILLNIAVAMPITAALYAPTIETLAAVRSDIHAARADSSRVRGALGRIALERWQQEAPIWGHGIVESGPHYVEYMPIGSHHTWLGLLFVKGIIGVIALAIPMIFSYLVLLCNAWAQPLNRHFIPLTSEHCLAISILLLLSFYSLSENLEILAYLYWPGLIILGHSLIKKPKALTNKPKSTSANTR